MNTTELMAGKRGLIMGVANNHSIAWGIAEACHAHGAELAFTYQGEAFGKRVKPLAESVGAAACLPCDVDSDDSIAQKAYITCVNLGIREQACKYICPILQQFTADQDRDFRTKAHTDIAESTARK